MSKIVSNKVMMASDRISKKIALLYFIYNDHDEELFENQLSDDLEVNYKIESNIFNGYYRGSTIFQIISNSTEISQMLIDRGADYTVTNKEGSTTLLEEISSKYHYYIDRHCQGESYVNLVLSTHIKSGNAQNPKDRNGLSHFHGACMYNHTDGVSFYLNNGVNVNETVSVDSEFYPGFSALHFSAKSCALETVELLLKSDADMFAEDSKGRNPLHILIIERMKAFITLRRFSRITPSERNESRRSNLQEYYIRNKKILTLCLERIENSGFESFEKMTLFFIYLICTEESSKIEQFIDSHKEELPQLINTGSQIFAGRTPVHFAALFSVEILEILLKNGANLATKDFNKVTPFDMCLKGFNVVDLHRIISSHPDYSKILFSNRKTKLSEFIYSMRELAIFEDFLKDNLTNANMFIPFDSPVCAGFTPLHLTVICTEQPLSWSCKNYDCTIDLYASFQSNESQKYLSRINLCLRYNADVTSRDARGSTPLHWAFRFQECYAVHRLLQQHESSSDYVDEYGLSHLQIACAAKDEVLVQKLLLGGANVDQVATLGYTCLDFNSGKPAVPGYQILKYFVDKGSTPLHFATTVYCPKIVDILLNHEAINVLAKDTGGLNPMERMLSLSIFVDNKAPNSKDFVSYRNVKREITEVLVRQIANLLVDAKPDQMMYCYRLMYDSGMLRDICRHNDESMMRIFENWGITALHVACYNKDLSQVSSLAVAGEIDVNARVNLKSILWPGCTPLHLFAEFDLKDRKAFGNQMKNIVIVRILLEYGADVAAKNADGETPLHQFFRFTGKFYRANDNGIASVMKMMLQFLEDFDDNPTNQFGITHLHIASAAGAASVVEKLLEHGAEIDQPTDYFSNKNGGYTALHFAIANRHNEVVDVLLKHGADVNWTNTYGQNALHVATKKKRLPSFELLEMLSSAGVDIYARNIYEDTPFESLIRSRNLNKREIEFFLEKGCSVNIFNPINDYGFLALALNRHRELHIFELLIQFPSVKDIDDNGRNAIHNVVSFKRPSWNTLGVWSIDEKYTPSDDYTSAIGALVRLDLKIDQIDYKSFTPLHLAARMQNVTGIIGLLENGADINITDADGKVAFDYSLEHAELCKEREELDVRIHKVISVHVFKLNLARIGVNQSNKRIVEEIREIYTIEESKVEECTNEMEKMMEEYVDSQSFTFHELLSDTGAVSAFPYMLPPTREAVDNYFKTEVDSLREKFPEFTGILLMQHRKAMSRCDIIHDAENSLDLLLKFNVPAVCSRIILEFLSNDDLTNLISSAL